MSNRIVDGGDACGLLPFSSGKFCFDYSEHQAVGALWLVLQAPCTPSDDLHDNDDARLAMDRIMTTVCSGNITYTTTATPARINTMPNTLFQADSWWIGVRKNRHNIRNSV